MSDLTPLRLCADCVHSIRFDETWGGRLQGAHYAPRALPDWRCAVRPSDAPATELNVDGLCVLHEHWHVQAQKDHAKRVINRTKRLRLEAAKRDGLPVRPGPIVKAKPFVFIPNADLEDSR